MCVLIRRLALPIWLLFGPSTWLFAQAIPRLEVLVLGSGGPGAAGRAASSYLILIDGDARILVDAGPGSFARLGEAKASLADTDIVLLTHLHIDHAGEIPGLFKARAVSGSGPITFNVWGPSGSQGAGENAYFPGTREFLRLLFGPKGAFAYLNDFAAPITLHGHDIPAPLGIPASLENATPLQILKQDGLRVTAIAGHHGDAPAVIYRVEHAGKSVTFSGDIDAQGLPALRRIAKATDLLVFNTVVLDPPGSPAILYTLHTPPHDIGLLAREVGAGALLLSHISPAVDASQRAVTESIRANYAGSVTFANDGMRARP
ncbi:MAG: MBL fold metallo-hydrolase [Steroidobacteraceae bacterium]